MSTLYRKYRPRNWRDVAGQDHVKLTLAQEVKSGRTAHAYVFSGPRGVGKTTVARILARALNCEAARGRADLEGNPCGECSSCRRMDGGEAMDIIEIDAASNRGIDAVRETVIEGSRFAPASLSRKVFIIDEVHMLTTEAFNALLKTLEEPPSHAVFILATTELHKVPATVVSRCQRFDFRKIPHRESVERLARVAESEGVELDGETLEEIARFSEGCMRDAESLLGKVVTLGEGGRISHEEASVVLPRSDWRRLGEYVEGLLCGDAPRAIAAVQDALAAGAQPAEFADGIVTVLRAVMLTKLTGDPRTAGPDLDESRLASLAGWSERADLAVLVRLVETMMEKRRDTRTAHPPQLPLEIAAVKAAGSSATVREAAANEKPQSAGRLPSPERRAKRSAAASAEAEAKTGSDEAARPEPYASVLHAHSVSEAATAEDGGDEAAGQVAAVAVAVAAEPHGGGNAPAVAVAAGIAEEPVCTIERLRECWPQFVRKASERNFSLPYLLGIGRPLEVRGNSAVIGFGFAFHCDKFSDPKNLEPMEQALAEVIGRAVRLEARLVPDGTAACDDSAATAYSESAAPHDELADAFGGRVIS